MVKRRANVKFIKTNSTKLSPFQKALSSNNEENVKESEGSREYGIIPHIYPISELQKLIEHSTILQQCIDAYKRNIVGFGATPAYNEDDGIKEETPEMLTEWDTILLFLKIFNFDKSFEDVHAECIDDREQTGNGYMEILRNGKGLVAGGERLDPVNMYVTKLSDPIQVEELVDGNKYTRLKRFRLFVQDLGTRKIFFKEFGDPRIINKNTGKEDATTSIEDEANEIIHFKIGSKPYGVPRWIGHLLHMYGARLAEELNYNYFTQGRHTPMAILLHNANLSPESEEQLIEYAKSVQGVDNAHKFLVIEAEGIEEGILGDEVKAAKVELKSLAEMLQNDAMFLEYDKGSREKVQSAFRLPDIYIGRSADFNRATADTARTITEEQVFEPERNSLEWVINNRLLRDYQLKHTHVEFKKPEISNIEELVGVIGVANEAGAVAPNDIRDIVGKYLGKVFEPLEGEQFNVPISYLQNAQQQLSLEAQLQNRIDSRQKEKEIEKSVNTENVFAIMKEVRDLLKGMGEDA